MEELIMKKRTFLLICILLTLLCACAVADVEINESNFPDANFRKYVKNNCDKDHNNYLSNVEISGTTAICCSDLSIKSLKGIELFTKLQELECSFNLLSTLSLNENTALTKLNCGYNELTKLDITKNKSLTFLDCSSNKLTKLNISNNTRLTDLWCYGNQLAKLNLQKNSALINLYCDDNKLTELNVSKNTALENLRCRGNKLTMLDVSKNKALTMLNFGSNEIAEINLKNNTKLDNLLCFNNLLTKLDISNNTALTLLWCMHNKLTGLDLSKNTALKNLDCSFNKITALDLSKNTALKHLSCRFNKMTALNVSNNPELIELYCYSNKIKQLDVSKCSALAYEVKEKERDGASDCDYWSGLYVDKFTTVIADNVISKPTSVTVNGLKYNLFLRFKTATFTGPANKSTASITIPATIKVNGKTYKVTIIGANACKNLTKLTKVTIGKNIQEICKNAFSGCKKLKTIDIKSTKLIKACIGTGCFKGINAKATFKCPKKQKKNYKTWLVKIGKAPKTAKFK